MQNGRYLVRNGRLLIQSIIHQLDFFVEYEQKRLLPKYLLVDLPIKAEHEVHSGFHYNVDAWGWEVPAGSVKPDQTELEAAVCELKEEVGGETEDDLLEIGRFYTANGICNELGVYYLATNVTLGEPEHEAAEVMEIHLKPIDEVLHMAHSGQINDGNTVLALLTCAEKLRALR